MSTQPILLKESILSERFESQAIKPPVAYIEVHTMAEMCNDCGLPQELCVCTDIDRSESPEVTITVEERRYNKVMTIVDGVAQNDVDDLSSDLKAAVGAGGTSDESDGEIQIQGDHRDKERFIEVIESYGYQIQN